MSLSGFSLSPNCSLTTRTRPDWWDHQADRKHDALAQRSVWPVAMSYAAETRRPRKMTMGTMLVKAGDVERAHADRLEGRLSYGAPCRAPTISSPSQPYPKSDEPLGFVVPAPRRRAVRCLITTMASPGHAAAVIRSLVSAPPRPGRSWLMRHLDRCCACRLLGSWPAGCWRAPAAPTAGPRARAALGLAARKISAGIGLLGVIRSSRSGLFSVQISQSSRTNKLYIVHHQTRVADSTISAIIGNQTSLIPP